MKLPNVSLYQKNPRALLRIHHETFPGFCCVNGFVFYELQFKNVLNLPQLGQYKSYIHTNHIHQLCHKNHMSIQIIFPNLDIQICPRQSICPTKIICILKTYWICPNVATQIMCPKQAIHVLYKSYVTYKSCAPTWPYKSYVVCHMHNESSARSIKDKWCFCKSFLPKWYWLE